MAEVKELEQYRNKRVYDNGSGGGGGSMDNFVTQKDLEALESKFNNKFDLHEKNLEILFLKEREFHRKNKVESIKWIVGTGIAVIGLIFTYLKFFA